jgi:hypothetical protein
MHESGLAAYAKREAKRTGIYSFENRPKELSTEYQKLFQANKKAWEFWEKQPPYFTKLGAFYVMSAKKEETQRRRLNHLIDAAAKGKRLGVIEAKPSKPEKRREVS